MKTKPLNLSLWLLLALQAPAWGEATRVCTGTDDCNFARGLAAPKTAPTESRQPLLFKGITVPQTKGIYVERDAPRMGAMIRFDFDDARVRADSIPVLRKLVVDMTQGALRNAVIQIDGHTDATGGDDYNQRLSERRSSAVVSFLVAQGVPRTRIESRGYGETSPICPNDTETRRAWNRRVEFQRVASLDASGREIERFRSTPGDRLEGNCDAAF